LKQLMSEQCAGLDVWAWKDPRNCECIEMWQDILKELKLQARYIIMVRNPVDVVASFRKAYGSRERTIIKLWQIRTLLSLRETCGEKRIIIDYDDFLENGFWRLHDISQTLDLPWPRHEARLRERLAAFIDPG